MRRLKVYKMIANEYGRLSAGFPTAIREAAEEMEAEGFRNASVVARKVLDLRSCRQ